MNTVGLLGIAAQEIATLARALPRNRRETLRFTGLPVAAELMAVEHLDFLAVAPGAKLAFCPPIPPCRLLLLPGSEGALLQRCKAACVMSYGGSSKDSLTLSSLAAGQASLAIQRELPTLTGGSIERQELVFPLAESKQARSLLFRVGLLLVLGVSVEDLPAALEIFGPEA